MRTQNDHSHAKSTSGNFSVLPYVWRTFNVDQDEHPVRYLLETWEPGMLDPLCLWLDEILDSEAPFCPDLKSMVLPVS